MKHILNYVNGEDDHTANYDREFDTYAELIQWVQDHWGTQWTSIGITVLP